MLLVNHYFQVFAEKNRKPAPSIDDAEMELLTAHEWRGNVRELQNVLEWR